MHSWPLAYFTRHYDGKNNVSLGVCLIGKNRFSEKQFLSLENILRVWKDKYPKAKIKGHFQMIKTDKTCPNFNIDSFLEKRKLI